jgi:hypothetical protein
MEMQVHGEKKQTKPNQLIINSNRLRDCRYNTGYTSLQHAVDRGDTNVCLFFFFLFIATGFFVFLLFYYFYWFIIYLNYIFFSCLSFIFNVLFYFLILNKQVHYRPGFMPVIPIYGEDMATSGSTRSVRDEGKKKPKNLRLFNLISLSPRVYLILLCYPYRFVVVFVEF